VYDIKSPKPIQEAFAQALKMMRNAGFGLSGSIQVVVDENLPFMGYTAGRWDKNLIVVSGMALRSGLVEGLLIHEMSHIYRTETKHPSHNHALLNDVLRAFISKHGIQEDYQLKILQGIVNHVQDLCADDIAFKVFEKNQDKLFPLNKMSDFFYSWIKTIPVYSADKVRERWMNAAIMLNNCFALSNMERHKIADVDDKVRETNQKFLDALDTKLSKEFTYFKSLMLSLRENVTGSEFQEQLNEYLRRFLELTA